MSYRGNKMIIKNITKEKKENITPLDIIRSLKYKIMVEKLLCINCF